MSRLLWCPNLLNPIIIWRVGQCEVCELTRVLSSERRWQFAVDMAAIIDLADAEVGALRYKAMNAIPSATLCLSRRILETSF
jgi:hypothetical protein